MLKFILITTLFITFLSCASTNSDRTSEASKIDERKPASEQLRKYHQVWLENKQ